MAGPRQANGSEIYQIKVTLKGSRPPIWRRIQVTSNTTLNKLHYILQAVMGWYGGHLHQFIIRGVYYSDPDPIDDWEAMENEDERLVKLKEVVSGVKTRFRYEYDFGDGWDHEILIEKALPPQEGVRCPVCLAGARACPPEDCGGIYGYYDLLETLGNPRHPEHKAMLEWVGGSFDPDAFDLTRINLRLKEFQRTRR